MAAAMRAPGKVPFIRDIAQIIPKSLRGGAKSGSVRRIMKRTDGFTLIELLVTLIMAAILIAAGVPGLRGLMSSSQASAQASDLVTALSFARSESIKRGDTVLLCAKSAKTQKRPGCGQKEGDWANGWLAFSDKDKTTPLRSWPAPPGNYRIAGPLAIRFDSSGAVQTDAAVTFTIEYSHCTGNQNRTITVHATGRTSVSKEACT